MVKFRVGLGGDFTRPDGRQTYEEFDIGALRSHPRIEIVTLPRKPDITAQDVAELDALIMLGEFFKPDSVHPNNRLALLTRFGVGFDRIDVPTCTKNGIAISLTPDAVRRPVAVSVMAFLLALTGKMFAKDKLTRRGAAGFAERSAHIGVGVVGRTLGLVGIGNIGAETARLAQPFGIKIIAHDPVAKPEAARALGIELVDLDDVFRRSDFISLHCPLNAATHHLVNAARIALMKPSAYLINTARGPVVDQMALTKALTERRIAGAGLDVFDPEPPLPDDPLLKLDNVIVAPHSLCHTDQCFGDMAKFGAESILAVASGQRPRAVADPKVFESPEFARKLAAYAKM